ncbi:MAG TPA: energy transducer TonB [Alphaproteobacteria bacterium]
MARAERRADAAAPWAVGGSVLAHVGAIAAALVVFADEPPGAMSPGVAGIEVMLGPMGGPAGAEPAKAEPVETPLPELEPVEPVEAVETPPEPPVEVVETPPEPEQVESEPPIAPLEDVITSTAPELAEIPPVEEPKVEEPPPPPTPRVQAKPKLKPEPPRRPAARKPDPKPTETQTAAIDPAPAGNAGAKPAPAAGSGNETAGGGVPGAPADYLARLRAWLERHKEYPRRALARHIEGTVLVHFVMDREGRVLSSRITRTSGHPVLDRAVEAMLERAQPLPRMPDDMPQQQLSLVVPIQFFMR